MTPTVIEKISNELISRIDQKFNELVLDMEEKFKISVAKISEDIINESITPLKNELKLANERIEALEAQSAQNDLIIHGLKLSNPEKVEGTPSNRPQPDGSKFIMDLVIEHLKNDMRIPISTSDINYAYSMKRKKDEQASSSILVNFTSISKKYEIIRKAKLLRKSENPHPNIIFYNERLSRKNSELSYKARSLLRIKKIQATWTYRSEIYILKDSFSKPTKITTLNDLEAYGRLTSISLNYSPFPELISKIVFFIKSDFLGGFTV